MIAGYDSGETTIATFAKFFAEARTIAGRRCRSVRRRRRRRAGGDGLDERIQVHDDELEGQDAELGELVLVVLEAQVGEQARVDARVQRLHAPAERLREAGDLGDVLDGESGLAQKRRRSTRRDELDAGAGERLRERQQDRSCR
jgi:hypothetical protein